MNIFKIATVSTAALLGVTLALGGVYVVPEGHVGVVKRFSKAVSQSDPGIHFKVALIDTVETMEVRQRRNAEELSAATKDQLPIRATVSVNWTVNKDAAMDIFIKYGGLEQFESRILDPKLREASKAALSKFSAVELIRNRERTSSEIFKVVSESLSDFPITINAPQVEDIGLPQAYQEAVMAKEKAREQAEQEKHKLEQQRLESLQKVNTAEAQKQALMLAADAVAYKTTTEAKAEADAIKQLADAEADRLKMINAILAQNPKLVEYIKAKQWDGKLPRITLGHGAQPMLNLGEEK